MKPPKPTARPASLPLPEPQRTLRYGTPEQAGLLRGPAAEISTSVAAGLEPAPERPAYPGAVVLAARNGVIVEHSAFGYALKYAGTGRPLPEGERVPMCRDTVFDLASVSKLFTAIAAMQLAERGRIDVESPVGASIPEFAQNGKEEITTRQLLTHTSGLPAWLPLYSSYASPQERSAAACAVEPVAEPGTEYIYSDVGMIALGRLVEAVSGQPLDAFVAQNVTLPLGMKDTGYNPPRSEMDRIAATEYQPWTGRGIVRGSVHDENAWALGGVAGHAGVFGKAGDLAVLAQTILNGGSYGGVRILRPDTVRELLTDYNAAFPDQNHGLGFELYQHWYMDALAAPATAGHTGFTGTSLVIEPGYGTFLILLTNRVHPSREWSNVNPQRRAAARALARAVPVDGWSLSRD